MTSKKLLSRFKLRATPLRENLINLFVNYPGVAFSETEINEMFSNTFDRVTVYRTIRTFLDKFIIHKVVCEDGVLKYAITPEQKNDCSHAHFQCTTCGTVSCLTQCAIEQFTLPEGYQSKGMQMLIKGLCPQCK